MRDLGVLGACLAAGAGVYVVLITPSWLFLGMNRSCLWQVRDEVFDARRTGELADAPSVEWLIESIESMIIALRFVTAGQMWLAARRRPASVESSGRWDSEFD